LTFELKEVLSTTMAKADPSVIVRSKTALWLLGSEETELKGSKLPSNRQMLCVFLHHHKTLKKTVLESARAGKPRHFGT